MPYSVRYIDGVYRIYNIREKKLLKPKYLSKHSALKAVKELYQQGRDYGKEA